MEKVNKSSTIHDPVARTLKYETDEKPLLSSSFRSPIFPSPQSKLFSTISL